MYPNELKKRIISFTQAIDLGRRTPVQHSNLEKLRALKEVYTLANKVFN